MDNNSKIQNQLVKNENSLSIYPTKGIQLEIYSYSYKLVNEFQPLKLEIIDESEKHKGHEGIEGTETHFKLNFYV